MNINKVSGAMKATGNGTVTITAKATDGSGKSATCKVIGTVLVNDFWFNQTEHTMYHYQYMQMGYTWTPWNAKDPSLKWESSDKDIATVDQNGTVYSNNGIWNGSAWITGTTVDGSNITRSFLVHVKEAFVEGISLSPSNLSLNAGDGCRLSWTMWPSHAANKSISWSSSNESVAAVSGGWVAAKGAGTCTITATTYLGYSASCTVTVKGTSSGGGSNGGSSGGGSGSNPNSSSNNDSNNIKTIYKGYRIGSKEDAPEFYTDNDFPYDPNEEANLVDYALSNSWTSWAMIWFSGRDDALMAYLWYRFAIGEDREVDYKRAYEEDSLIQEKVDDEVDKIMSAAYFFYKEGAGRKFTLISKLVNINQKLPNSNWDMTLGQHSFYAFATVNIGGDGNAGIANVSIEIVMEDTYNFNNDGQTFNMHNGRFATLGWAKPFKHYGSFTINESFYVSK